MTTTVVAVISGLTYKRGERVNVTLYCPFRLVRMPCSTTEYLNVESAVINNYSPKWR